MKRSSFAALVLVIASLARAATLDDVSAVVDRTSHRASSHDPTGGNEDSLVSFAPGETRVLLDADGPGRVTHVWMTLARFVGHECPLRDLVFRMYWENSSVPSVEVPLGDFFGLSHGRMYTFQSAVLAVGQNPKALNCYWPMPFHKHARIEIFNAGNRSIRRLYYNIDYELGPIPPEQALFHALYHRERTLTGQPSGGNTTGAANYVILETQGRGQYVGCTLSVDARPGGWWGEGDDMIFIDHSEKPVIIGTGSEDYFCNAWGYDAAFSYLYYGAPLMEDKPDGGKLATVYRWHIPDPVRFKTHIRVTIEHVFSPKVANDYTSVAYWYQTEPLARRPASPPAADNQPGTMSRTAASQPAGAVVEVDATELEPDLLARGVKARAITADLHAGYENGGWLRVETDGKPVELYVSVPEDRPYRVRVKPVLHLIENQVSIGLKGAEPKSVQRPEKPKHESKADYVDLGRAKPTDGRIAIVISGQDVIGLDGFNLTPVGE